MFGAKNIFSTTQLKLFSPTEYIKITDEIDGGEYERTLYRTTAEKARIRLEILGCSEKKLKEYFQKGLKYKRAFYDEDCFYDEKHYYSKMNYDDYSEALGVVLSSKGLDIYDDDVLSKNVHLSNNIFTIQILRSAREMMCFNPIFHDYVNENETQFIDQMLDMYMCIINVNQSATIEYELTDIISGGWISELETQDFFSDFMDTTIILTEGKTDVKVLSKSLELIYPDFKHLYTFFDFHTYKADGGTAYLAKLIKSFSASKINNRIIALFDNDTAALLEMEKLSKLPISDNIRVMKLPWLEFCESYPTLGPTGKENMNINGLAVSIELFFGQDILKCNSDYSPVQWTDYVKSMGKYQGSIIDKSEVNTLMEKKLKHPDLENQDWDALKLLWENIFKGNL